MIWARAANHFVIQSGPVDLSERPSTHTLTKCDIILANEPLGHVDESHILSKFVWMNEPLTSRTKGKRERYTDAK